MSVWSWHEAGPPGYRYLQLLADGTAAGELYFNPEHQPVNKFTLADKVCVLLAQHDYEQSEAGQALRAAAIAHGVMPAAPPDAEVEESAGEGLTAEQLTEAVRIWRKVKACRQVDAWTVNNDEAMSTFGRAGDLLAWLKDGAE